MFQVQKSQLLQDENLQFCLLQNFKVALVDFNWHRFIGFHIATFGYKTKAAPCEQSLHFVSPSQYGPFSMPMTTTAFFPYDLEVC